MIKKFLSGVAIAAVIIVSLVARTPQFPDTTDALHISYSGPVDRLMYESIVKQTEGVTSSKHIVFKITTHGGYLYYEEKILAHLRKLTPDLIIEVPDYAISAGAFMLARADHIIVAKNAIILFHVPRISSEGNHLTITPKFNYENFKEISKSSKLTTILRNETLVKYLSGVDVVLTGIKVAIAVNDPSIIKVVEDPFTPEQHIDHVIKEMPTKLVQ